MCNQGPYNSAVLKHDWHPNPSLCFKPQNVLFVSIKKRHKQKKLYVLLLTCDQYEPVDVLIEFIQNFAIHWSKIRWGHEVLLGPLQLTMQPCHPVLQQSTGGCQKGNVSMGNADRVSVTFWTSTPKITEVSNEFIIRHIMYRFLYRVKHTEIKSSDMFVS